MDAARTTCVWCHQATRLHAQQIPHLQLEAVPMHVRPSLVQASTCNGMCCTAACEREPVLQAGLACACSPSLSLCPLPKSALHTRQLAACITGGRTHVHVAPTYAHVPLPEHSRHRGLRHPWQGIRGCLHMVVQDVKKEQRKQTDRRQGAPGTAWRRSSSLTAKREQASDLKRLECLCAGLRS